MMDSNYNSREEEDDAMQEDVRVDYRRKLVWIDGVPVRLTGNEFALLSLLASDPERVFSCEEIIEAVWPARARASRSDVRQAIYRLRQRIERDPQAPSRVITVTGFGYFLAGGAEAES